MSWIDNNGAVFACVCFVQLLGLASLLLVRICDRLANGQLQSLVFFVCLAIVGGVTMAAASQQSSLWLGCGTTFAVMVVGATLDFRGVSRASSY